MASTVLLLHPGEMGAAVGACLRHNGHRVLWVSAGRSSATARRADQAQLEAVPSLEGAVAQADIVLSVCPPHAAVQVARHCIEAGFKGIYVDANAIAPSTARRIEAHLAQRKISFVDGGIIGPPQLEAGTTRLYLAGAAAQTVANLFPEGPLTCPVLTDGAGAGSASALKMCYAAWTKGASALLTAIRALADQEAVHSALIDEWHLSLPGTAERSEAITRQARKAWRWVGEMEEIATTFKTAELPPGFHEAAADIYTRLTPFKDASEPVSIANIIAAINAHHADNN